MSCGLVAIIREQTEILFKNASKTIQAVDDDLLGLECAGLPLWQHLYHTLHSLDQWFINPRIYSEPRFHESGSNSLSAPHPGFIAKQSLSEYFEIIRAKVSDYLDSLTDEDIANEPDRSEYTRLALIMAQSRHFMYHIGFIHSCIKSLTGKWPEYAGISRPPVS